MKLCLKEKFYKSELVFKAYNFKNYSTYLLNNYKFTNQNQPGYSTNPKQFSSTQNGLIWTLTVKKIALL